jgi:gliding motility-associated-like protein
VKLKQENVSLCKPYPTENPVVSQIDISETRSQYTPSEEHLRTSILWTILTGRAPTSYQCITRGEAKVFVKDGYNCVPIEVNITIPNLINIITPNDDGINDAVDYSSLAKKKNLKIDIYDRYGTQVYRADKSNRYKWDGTANGRKVSTGNYWYAISWNENDKQSTQIQFSGWIVVKNRD